MRKLLIVDGSNLLFQMFYGMPARITGANGKAIQGTLGFIGALLKIIRMVKPTHAAVLFDGECDNGRAALDENYKANRIDYSQLPAEESPFSQLPDIYAALTFLGIAHAETTDCEADDWIASYALTLGCDTQIVIASQDSDYFQLITENVRILRYRGEKPVVCDESYIREKLGIEATQYADFKSLTGDSSDNIRGAHKVGPKTAAQLLRQYGSLENLLQNAHSIQKPSIRESIVQSAPRLRTNYLLIRLQGCADVPLTMEQLSYRESGLTTSLVLQGIGLR